MEISKETYQQADDKTQRNMIFDLTLDLHECVKGNSKPGLMETVTKHATSIKWIRIFIVGILLAVVGVVLK